MSYPGPGAQPTALLVDGAPVSTTNPLPISGSGSSTVLPVELRGLQQNQTTLKSVGVDNFGNLGASIADPLSAFNELLVAEPLPRVQIDAAYGLLTTDIETRTSLSGAATAANALFDVQTGTTAGAYAVLRSRRARRGAADCLFDRDRRRVAQLARGIINVA